MNNKTFRLLSKNPAIQTPFLKSALNIPGELRRFPLFFTNKGKLVNIARQSYYVNKDSISQLERKKKNLDTKKTNLNKLRLQTKNKLARTKVYERRNYYNQILQTIDSALENTTNKLESFKIEQQLPSLNRARKIQQEQQILDSTNAKIIAEKKQNQALNDLLKRIKILQKNNYTGPHRR